MEKSARPGTLALFVFATGERQVLVKLTWVFYRPAPVWYHGNA
jgi:hypothetical protein